MNALFFTMDYFEDGSGVRKKITMQVEALKRQGFGRVFTGVMNKDRVLEIDGEKLTSRGSISSPKAQVAFFNQVIEYINSHDIGFVFYRFNGISDPWIVWLFVRKLKKSGIRCVMEIPTYPYDGEKKNKDRFYYLDRFTRGFLAKQAERIVTFSDTDRIFGQKTVTISNGIDLNKIPLKADTKSEAFNVLAVANLRYWHGYDRFVLGMKEYLQKSPHRDIVFHIVSGYPHQDTEDLKALVKKLQLEDNVIFYGRMDGTELDALFDKCQFAIGCLGCHRKNIVSVKALKNVEYAARGISFLYSEVNDDFDHQPYVIKAAHDESPIDIEALLEKYDSISMTPAQIRETVKHLSWDNQMAKILDSISLHLNSPFAKRL